MVSWLLFCDSKELLPSLEMVTLKSTRDSERPSGVLFLVSH